MTRSQAAEQSGLSSQVSRVMGGTCGSPGVVTCAQPYRCKSGGCSASELFLGTFNFVFLQLKETVGFMLLLSKNEFFKN